MYSLDQRIKKYIAHLASPDMQIALKAENALVRLGDKATDVLREACQDPNPQVRFRAVWTLGLARDPRAYETIVRLMADPEERVSYDAVMALGKYKDARAVEPLIALIRRSREEDPLYLSSAAASSLVALGEAGVDSLLQVLEDGHPEARKMAAWVLGKIGGQRAMEPLSRFLADEDAEMRQVGIESLADIGHSNPDVLVRCIAFIEPLMNDPKNDVRRTASYWIKEMSLPGNISPS